MRVVQPCLGKPANPSCIIVGLLRIRTAAVRAEIPVKLVTALSFDDPHVLEEAAGTLKNMSVSHAETLVNTDAPRELARLLLSDSAGVRQQAEGALINLAKGVRPPTAGGAPQHPVVRAVLDIVGDAKDISERLRDQLNEHIERPDESAALKAKVRDLQQQLDSQERGNAVGVARATALAERCAELEESNRAIKLENTTTNVALADAARELSTSTAEEIRFRDAAAVTAAQLALKEETIETLEITIMGLEARIGELEQQTVESQRRRGSAITRRTPPVPHQRSSSGASPAFGRSSAGPSPGFGSTTPRNIGDLTREKLAASQPRPRTQSRTSTSTFVVSGSENSSPQQVSPTRSSPPSVDASPAMSSRPQTDLPPKIATPRSSRTAFLKRDVSDISVSLDEQLSEIQFNFGVKDEDTITDVNSGTHNSRRGVEDMQFGRSTDTSLLNLGRPFARTHGDSRQSIGDTGYDHSANSSRLSLGALTGTPDALYPMRNMLNQTTTLSAEPTRTEKLLGRTGTFSINNDEKSQTRRIIVTESNSPATPAVGGHRRESAVDYFTSTHADYRPKPTFG
jgi:hypothetical protein